jgi:opacity protein-like surface antigen
MASAKICIPAAAAAMIGSMIGSAFAADMPLPPPAPIAVEQPASAWYLRGDVGIGVLNQVDFIFQSNPASAPPDILSQQASLGDTTIFSMGVGYEWNRWLRFDVTGEYRTKSGFNAFIMYDCGGTCVAGDQYNAFLKSEVFLANAYIDLGTWDCLTPFIGFGVGGALNTWNNLFDTGIGTSGNGVGTNPSKFNFAWAAYAGLAYDVTKTFTVEATYRYLNYGSVSDQIYCMGGCAPDTYKLNNLTSNDFLLGMRWRFPIEGSFFAAQPAVLMQPAAPIYQPPAPAPQYPLSTRG